jgi:hypothetical protein
MNLYEKGFNILNDLHLLPLKITNLNKDYQKNIIVSKKFNLNNKSKKIINKIKNIEIIVMTDEFNTKIKIPEGINEIIFGKKFNHKIQLPKSLKKLTMGDNFNQIIEYPDNLEILNCGKDFNQLIPLLPEKMKYISVSEDYTHPIQSKGNLEEIYIYHKKPIILPISNEEVIKRYNIEPSGIKIFKIKFNLADSDRTRRIALLNEFLMDHLFDMFIDN